MEYSIEIRAELTAAEFAGILGALEARGADREAKKMMAEESKAMLREKLNELLAKVAASVGAGEGQRGEKPDGPAVAEEPADEPDDEYIRTQAIDDLERRLAAEDRDDPEEPDEAEVD